MTDRKPTARVTLSLPPELSFAAIGLATVEYTTVAAICRRALDDYLSKRGYLGEQLGENEEAALLQAAGITVVVNESIVDTLDACGLLENRTIGEAVSSLVEVIETN